MNGSITLAGAALAFLTVCLPSQAQVPAVDRERPAPVIIEPTAREFLNSCASCHGMDGKGAGFLTRLFRGVDPGDLTQLAANNGGTFPLERAFAVIDGRAEVAAHGDRKMPVWGDRYMNAEMSEWGPDELNELRVRNRIYALVHYLQSMQETGGNTQQ
ncbi:hypothetical protein SAMN04488047_1572 [Tranquillimonas alkanivorans]|uniref:Cytochrome c domain-containing protein n=1 Tax=Tranquillimonas alkanivorans TaxID=441119 RepID=A0A1I5WT70_9RHOB|nr:hypothetical protein SAMN04488047_1572 [Tranquillimonas alkanivorans]